jgi:hypothetical protein
MKYMGLIQWLRNGLQRQSVEDEEKDVCNALVATNNTGLVQWLRDGLQQRQSVADEEKDAINALVATNHTGLIQWLRNGLQQRQSVEEEEKDAITIKLHESNKLVSKEDDALSTTMEEDIAQFRAAAGAVGDLIAAEERRGRPYEHPSFTRPRRASTPSSILSACPTYRSVDEALPAYDENPSPEYVVDGFRYTPENLTTDGSITSRSSLDKD